MKPAKLKTLFRLRGQIGDTPIIAVLADGETSVGAHPQADLVLASPGVSRRHAVLKLTGRTLTVIDSGSKNGTFVNRDRVDRGLLSVGDRIHFGSVGLVLEEVEADDVIVGLALSDEPDSASDLEAEPDDTMSLSQHRPGVVTASLGLLHTLVDHIHSEGEPALAPAIEHLRSEFSAEGVAMMVVDRFGEPGLLVASGTLPDISPTTELGVAVAKTVAKQTEPTGFTSIAGALPVAFAWARTKGNETRVLLVFRPSERASVLPLLEVAVRLLAPRRRWSSNPRARLPPRLRRRFITGHCGSVL